MSHPEYGPSADFRLEYRRHRLRFIAQPAFHPSKLGRIQCGHMNHGYAHAATVVNKLAAQRIGESHDRMLGSAIGRLQRYAPVGEGRAYLHDLAPIAWQHALEGRETAVDYAEISDI